MTRPRALVLLDDEINFDSATHAKLFARGSHREMARPNGRITRSFDEFKLREITVVAGPESTDAAGHRAGLQGSAADRLPPGGGSYEAMGSCEPNWP